MGHCFDNCRCVFANLPREGLNIDLSNLSLDNQKNIRPYYVARKSWRGRFVSPHVLPLIAMSCNNPPTLPVERVDPSSVPPFQISELFQTTGPQGGCLPPPFYPLPGHCPACAILSRPITSPFFFDVNFHIDFWWHFDECLTTDSLQVKPETNQIASQNRSNN